MNDGENNEESERDGQDEQETGGDELSEGVRADIVQHPDQPSYHMSETNASKLNNK